MSQSVYSFFNVVFCWLPSHVGRLGDVSRLVFTSLGLGLGTLESHCWVLGPWRLGLRHSRSV